MVSDHRSRLVYLAVTSFLAARHDQDVPAQELRAPLGRVYGKAVLTNLANRKVIAR